MPAGQPKKYHTEEEKKEAVKRWNKISYHKNRRKPERIQQCRESDLRARLKNPIRTMMNHAKSRAKSIGMDFNLEILDMPELPENCPILGIKLESGIGKPKYNSYSLDRVRNELGYVKGNVAIISLRANRLKNNLTIEEIDNLHRYVHEHIDRNRC